MEGTKKMNNMNINKVSCTYFVNEMMTVRRHWVVIIHISMGYFLRISLKCYLIVDCMFYCNIHVKRYIRAL